jgi:hypothetical protein
VSLTPSQRRKRDIYREKNIESARIVREKGFGGALGEWAERTLNLDEATAEELIDDEIRMAGESGL